MRSVLAVDIGSGGVTAARLDTNLRTHDIAESVWKLERDHRGSATLSGTAVLDQTAGAIRHSAASGSPPEALVISSMMHTLVVVDGGGVPRTPVFTWLDTATVDDGTRLGQRLGAGYTKRTGAWCHPSFPAYKLARLRRHARDTFAPGYRILSLPGYVQSAWTGALSEDESTASASGLLNLESGHWDTPTLGALELDEGALPALTPTGAVIGHLSPDAAARLGLPAGLPVIAGGGDGFLASVGSGCRSPDQLAVTLGTTAGVRRFQNRPEDVTDSGLFCYRFRSDRYLVGCASNNGGNVLDWARAEFPGEITLDGSEQTALPIFLPFVFGERAPFWDSTRAARWFEVTADHTPDDLGRSVAEAVTFTLGMYIRLLIESLGTPSIAVLSGNGFHTPGIAQLLAALSPCPLVIPSEAGTATLRGAAATAFETLGVGVENSLEDLLEKAKPVEPVSTSAHLDRFERFAESYRG